LGSYIQETPTNETAWNRQKLVHRAAGWHGTAALRHWTPCASWVTYVGFCSTCMSFVSTTVGSAEVGLGSASC
jgi:hypothetical protein